MTIVEANVVFLIVTNLAIEKEIRMIKYNYKINCQAFLKGKGLRSLIDVFPRNGGSLSHGDRQFQKWIWGATPTEDEIFNMEVGGTGKKGKEATSCFKRPDLQYRTNWSSIRHWLEGRLVALH